MCNYKVYIGFLPLGEPASKLNPINELNIYQEDPTSNISFNTKLEFENTRHRYSWICSIRDPNKNFHFCSATLLGGCWLPLYILPWKYIFIISAWTNVSTEQWMGWSRRPMVRKQHWTKHGTTDESHPCSALSADIWHSLQLPWQRTCYDTTHARIQCSGKFWSSLTTYY